MTKTPWTPGPWRVEFDPGNMMEFDWYVAALDQTTVAAMYLNASQGDGGASGESNAHLIAAAPEMAELLQEALDDISAANTIGWEDRVHAVLAKARWETE
ncbi:MAG: hypothetical protein KDH09_06080 [Chrysiogenetes bacterium]|nr:hypothetical protein [Chrysiogenetes bacterium]